MRRAAGESRRRPPARSTSQVPAPAPSSENCRRSLVRCRSFSAAFRSVISCATTMVDARPVGSGTKETLISHHRSEEHTSELQSLMRISYAVFCLKKKKKTKENNCNLANQDKN